MQAKENLRKENSCCCLLICPTSQLKFKDLLVLMMMSILRFVCFNEQLRTRTRSFGDLLYEIFHPTFMNDRPVLPQRQGNSRSMCSSEDLVPTKVIARYDGFSHFFICHWEFWASSPTWVEICSDKDMFELLKAERYLK